MVVMSACKDDDSPVLEPQPEDLTPFAMTYVDFITPDDVQILSADTTRISVSSAYAEKMGIKFFKDRANQDNVLLIWSGHGAPGTLLWDENQKTITGDFMSDLFNEMYAAGKYRKLFGIIEACYAGSVAAKCVGVPNLLLMTAANDKETSKAELYTPLWGTYLTNSFSMATLQALQDKDYDSLSIRDLYSEAFSKTMGSHVTLYNMENFGNVFFNYVYDYFMNLPRMD